MNPRYGLGMTSNLRIQLSWGKNRGCGIQLGALIALTFIAQTALSQPPSRTVNRSSTPQAQRCERPPLKNACVQFEANKSKTPHSHTSKDKKFIYLEGFGGPTGFGKRWWEDMSLGEQRRTQARARNCRYKKM